MWETIQLPVVQNSKEIVSDLECITSDAAAVTQRGSTVNLPRVQQNITIHWELKNQPSCPIIVPVNDYFYIKYLFKIFMICCHVNGI